MEEFHSKLKSEQLDALFKVILLLESEEDCYRFFEDICTISEIHAIGQRLEVAKRLRAGITYQDIAQKLGASTATISRVNRSLSYGMGGYQRMLHRLEEKQEKEQKTEQ